MDLDIFDIAISQGIEQILPFAQQVVDRYDIERDFTEVDIDRMTNEVVALSQQYGFSPAMLGGRSLNEAARFLILLNLFNYGYSLNPFWLWYFGGIPSFWFPFIGAGWPPFIPPPVRPPVRPVPPIGRPPFSRPPRGRRRWR